MRRGDPCLTRYLNPPTERERAALAGEPVSPPAPSQGRTYGYTRVSTEMQAEHGQSPVPRAATRSARRLGPDDPASHRPPDRRGWHSRLDPVRQALRGLFVDLVEASKVSAAEIGARQQQGCNTGSRRSKAQLLGAMCVISRGTRSRAVTHRVPGRVVTAEGRCAAAPCRSGTPRIALAADSFPAWRGAARSCKAGLSPRRPSNFVQLYVHPNFTHTAQLGVQVPSTLR